MEPPTRIAKLQSWIIQVHRGIWAFVRMTNLLALGAERFHSSWVQGIGAAIFCALWVSGLIGVYILNGLFGIDYVELGPVDWQSWVLLPLIALLASHLGCIFIGRFLLSKTRVAAILAANDLPASSSIYKIDDLYPFNLTVQSSYGFVLWLTTNAVGVIGLLSFLGFLMSFLGIAPPVP